MTISKLTKGILNAYLIALIAAALVAGMSNAVARSAFMIEGGHASSQAANGEPDYSASDILIDGRESR